MPEAMASASAWYIWAGVRIADRGNSHFPKFCHSGESRNLFDVNGIPAFAGMTV
jgi:hypothetical protein